MANTLIKITNGVPRHPDYRLNTPLNFRLTEGECLAICGCNGSGKSLFVDILTGAHPLLGDAISYDFGTEGGTRAANNVRLVSFRDVYGGNEPSYYQQRWNQADEQTFPTVAEVLLQAYKAWNAEGEIPNECADLHHLPNQDLLNDLGIFEHIDKPINLLSSGELRRMQLSKMLMSKPRVLIVDNPYIGLDKAARQMLTRVLEKLSVSITLVLVVSREEDIPQFVSRVVWFENKQLKFSISYDVFQQMQNNAPKYRVENISVPQSTDPNNSNIDDVIDFRNIHIQYGNRTILRGLNWHVKCGEHWALMGENGAGKSTLLSLVCADNPQSYACDIRLFGHQRGKGESIWEIKKHIGYVSPEIYSTYRRSLPAIDIVASGMHDTIGLYKRPTEAERNWCLEWLRTFNAAHLATQNYMQLSSGEQRLILLVRAFVKNPDLLILDEPFHGLDNHYRQLSQSIIDHYMQSPTKTLIMVTHYEEELPLCIDHRLELKKNA